MNVCKHVSFRSSMKWQRSTRESDTRLWIQNAHTHAIEYNNKNNNNLYLTVFVIR